MLRVSKSVKNVNNYQVTVFFILSTSHVLLSFILLVFFLYSILL